MYIQQRSFCQRQYHASTPTCIRNMSVQQKLVYLLSFCNFTQGNSLYLYLICNFFLLCSEYAPRSVVLQKGPEGYGFVLRGAKCTYYTEREKKNLIQCIFM